jgi:hypothetical protein
MYMSVRGRQETKKEKAMQQVATEQEAPGSAGRQRKATTIPVTAQVAAPAQAPAKEERRRDGAAPPWLGSMTVAAAAHEALFKAGPKLIFAEADSATARELALPRWLQAFVFSIHDGVGRLSTLNRGDGDASLLALAVPPADCLGLIAFTTEAAATLTACAAWFTENGPGAAPAVKLLGGRVDSERRTALLDFLLGRLHAEQAATLQRNAVLHRSLSELRESHEATQSVLFMMSDTLARHQLPAIECALTLRPGGTSVHPSGDGKQTTAIRQRLPLSSQGLAAVALHVTMGARFGRGRLLVRLTALESSSQLISWAIPYEHLRPGWNFLEIPTVVAGPRQTVELEARWDGDLRGAPQLSLSSQFIGPEGCPEIDGGPRARNPLAMQIWTGLPGARRVSSAFADPADLQRAVMAGRQLLLSPATLSQARLVAPQESVGFDVLTIKDDGRVLQLHPVAGRISHAVIPLAVPAGARRITAAVQTDNAEGPWVEYAMMLTSAGARANFPTAEQPAPSPVRMTEWLAVPPATLGSLVLSLEEPMAGVGDLHIATRLPPSMGDSYAWAQWKLTMIELG